jgi:hypothetical protein
MADLHALACSRLLAGGPAPWGSQRVSRQGERPEEDAGMGWRPRPERSLRVALRPRTRPSAV